MISNLDDREEPLLIMTDRGFTQSPTPRMGHRMEYLLDYLGRKGTRHTVIFPVGKEGQQRWERGSGSFIGVPAAFLGPFPSVFSRRDVQKNIVRLTRLMLRVLSMKDRAWKVCVAHGDMMGAVAIALRKLGRIERVVYEDLDYLPGFTGSKRDFTTSQIAMTEKLVVRNSDLVVSVSEALKGLRVQQGARRVITVPNGVDCRAFADAPAAQGRKPLLLYSGSLENWSGVHMGIESLPIVLKTVPDAVVRVIGAGKCEDELRALAKREGVDVSVDFLGIKNRSELPGLYGECSVGMATFPRTLLMRYSSPLKVPEFLAAGLPVVSTGADDTKGFLEETRSGIIVEENPASVADACIRLLSERNTWQEMSGNASAAAKRLDWNLLFDEEMKQIRSLT